MTEKEIKTVKQHAEEWRAENPKECKELAISMIIHPKKTSAKVFADAERVVPNFRGIIERCLDPSDPLDLFSVIKLLQQSLLATKENKFRDEIEQPKSRMRTYMSLMYHSQNWLMQFVVAISQLIKRNKNIIHQDALADSVDAIVKFTVDTDDRIKEEWMRYSAKRRAIEDGTVLEWAVGNHCVDNQMKTHDNSPPKEMETTSGNLSETTDDKKDIEPVQMKSPTLINILIIDDKDKEELLNNIREYIADSTHRGKANGLLIRVLIDLEYMDKNVSPRDFYKYIDSYFGVELKGERGAYEFYQIGAHPKDDYYNSILRKIKINHLQ